MGSRNGHSALQQVWWGAFQTDTKGEPAGVFLLPFAKQLFQVWTLSERERNVSGSDVPRRLNETSTAFCRAFVSTPCRALYFRPLIFRGLLCEPEAKSHLLAKCGLQGMPSWQD
jgi:hypothetical protein